MSGRYPSPVPPRTQSERKQATVTALLSAARNLLVRDGYAATSLDEVVARAGLTKGALYHHFAGKQALFRAVYEQELQRMLAMIEDRASKGRGQKRAWDGLQAACEAFLDASLDPAIQRITLLDAPTALGWETMREIENNTSLRLLKQALKQAMAEGSITPRAVDPLANLLFGAMCEAAMAIAREPNQTANARRTRTELRRLLKAVAAR
ncbi:MAG: TetR/AcrR family transcriptional regulator [Solirubrobacteraceae bacterium]